METKSGSIKKRIIEYSGNQFFKIGPNRVTMEEIANGLHISKKTLYRYFSNKMELIQAVLENLSDVSSNKIEETLGKKESAFIERFQEFLTYLGREISQISPIFIIDLKQSMPDMWVKIEEQIQRDLNRVIDEGRKSNQLNSQFDNQIIIDTFIGASQRLLDPDRLIQSSRSLDEVVHALVTILFEGIISRGR